MSEPLLNSGQTEADSCLQRAWTHMDSGKFDSALEECTEALRLVPDSAEVHNLCGIVFEELGRAEEALASYREAVRLNPEFADAQVNLGELEQNKTQNGGVLC